MHLMVREALYMLAMNVEELITVPVSYHFSDGSHVHFSDNTTFLLAARGTKVNILSVIVNKCLVSKINITCVPTLC